MDDMSIRTQFPKLSDGDIGGIVVEHRTLNLEVLGSITTGGTKLCP